MRVLALFALFALPVFAQNRPKPGDDGRGSPYPTPSQNRPKPGDDGRGSPYPTPSWDTSDKGNWEEDSWDTSDKGNWDKAATTAAPGARPHPSRDDWSWTEEAWASEWTSEWDRYELDKAKRDERTDRGDNRVDCMSAEALECMARCGPYAYCHPESGFKPDAACMSPEAVDCEWCAAYAKPCVLDKADDHKHDDHGSPYPTPSWHEEDKKEKDKKDNFWKAKGVLSESQKKNRQITAWVGLGLPAAAVGGVWASYIFGPSGILPEIR